MVGRKRQPLVERVGDWVKRRIFYGLIKMSDIKQPEPEYIANAPPCGLGGTSPEYEKIPHKEAQTVCFADLSKEERMMFADKLCCKKFKKHVEDFEACGGYDRAKRDWCKEMREEKEREEKAKAERLAVLEAREAVWVADARAKEKEFADYKAKTEERLSKLASLVTQLMKR